MKMPMRHCIALLPATVLFLASCSALHDAATSVPQHDKSPSGYCYNGVLLSEAKGDLNSAYDILTFISETDTAFAPAYDKMFAYEMGFDNDSLAVAMLDKAVANDPGNFWYGFKLANYYAAQDSMDKAASIYESLLSDDPSRKELLYPLVSWYSQEGDFDKALSALDRLEAQSGVTDESFITRMRIYTTSGKSELAKSQLQAKIAESPSDDVFKEFLAYIYMNETKFPEAISLYDAMLKDKPYDSELNYSRLTAFKLSDSTMFDKEAKRVLMDKAYARDVKLNILVNLVIKDKTLAVKPDVVSGFFVAALAGVPVDDVDILGLQGAYLMMLNDTTGYITVTREILHRQPSNASANATLMQYYLSRNDADGVSRVAKNAVKYFPEELSYHFYLAVTYLMKGDNDNALKVCETAVGNATPETQPALLSQLYSIIGDIRHEKGDDAGTFAAYDKALEYDKDNASVLNNYAYFLAIGGGDLSRAEEMISHAVELTPDDPTMLDTYAWVLFLQGDYALAKIYMDKTLQLDKQPSGEVLEHAGDIYFKYGETDRAVQFWQQSLEQGNGSEVLKAKIKQRKYIKQ